MERVVEITKEEYLVLGDAGVWVRAQVRSYENDVPEPGWCPDNSTEYDWNYERDAVLAMTGSRERTKFYTKVSEDGTVD